MRQRVRPHLTYANVVSTLCLFLLLGGTAVALDGSLAGKNTVGSEDIIGGEVKNTDLGSDSVGSGKIVDGAVKNADLGSNAASSNTIADGGVRSIDVDNGELTGADIGDESLTEDEIADIASSGGVTQIAVGDEKTLLQDGPFTVTATCEPDSSEEAGFSSYVRITSSEQHSVASLDADGVGGGGSEIPDLGRAIRAPSDPYDWQGSHFFAAAPSGATLQGYIGAGAQLLGYDDCTAAVTAIGTSALGGP